jgi:two-component system sensor histidine kinase GlrK
MKLSIFSRMVISLLAIFILSMAMSSYTIYQLHTLEDITNTIVDSDEFVDFGKQLSLDFLELRKDEKKYIISKDEDFYKSFDKRRAAFEGDLEKLLAMADTPELRDRLGEVEKQYERYQDSFAVEVKYIQSGDEYPQELFEVEKEEIEKAISRVLVMEVGDYGQERKQGKFKQLIEAESRTITVALGITITSLIFIIAISILITINITKPLSAMKKKTREIAKGDFGGHLELSSPPEIKELEQAFNSMCARLQEIDKIKSDFYSLMSHELRTPLASIKEGTSLLIESFKAKDITAKQKKLLAIMTEESNRLIKLVNSLLDLSKMEAGMMVYAFASADLIVLIRRAVREIGPLAEKKSVTITVEAGEGLPLIQVDTERMLQVLRNLIGNAVKFTPRDGHVHVSAQASEQGIAVSVKDTGVGISTESLTTIFDKFQQDVLTHSSKIKGTGLGLSFVKHIIKDHGGKIWAESTLGQGSTFIFVLPV